MKRIIRFLKLLICDCIGIGFVVSSFEDKKGWVSGHKPKGIYEKHFKRPLDYGLALFALIITWPFILIIALAVRIKLGSPVIYTQERPGLGGEIFKIKKFRTMTDDRDENGKLLPDEKRLTKFGRFLRSTSLDELPELLNIISGDMSVIGPRPQLVRDMVFMSDAQKKRHDVRPGLSGLAQVNGRNSISWEDKLKFDLDYIDRISFITDFGIFAETVYKIIGRKESAEEIDVTDDFGDYLLKTGKITRDEYDSKQKEAGELLKDGES